MTTTSTFQGMNSDSKPSSRVLNPPGGASSNIFGSNDASAPQRTPIKNNPDNINRGNNDIFHQGTHPAESTPTVRNAGNVNRQTSDIFNQGTGASAAQPAKSRAPRSAYNPITGEAYEQTNAKQEQTAQYGSTQLKSDEVQAVEEVKGEDERYNYEENHHKTNQACQESQGGVFGNGPDHTQEHRSTRVSQPPGGRSTKLW